MSKEANLSGWLDCSEDNMIRMQRKMEEKGSISAANARGCDRRNASALFVKKMLEKAFSDR
jgi:hypothetical protein